MKVQIMKKCMKREEYDLEINLTVLKSEEGGGIYGIRSGYCCTVDSAGT